MVWGSRLRAQGLGLRVFRFAGFWVYQHPRVPFNGGFRILSERYLGSKRGVVVGVLHARVHELILIQAYPLNPKP